MGRTLPNRFGGDLIGAKKPAIAAPLMVGICPDTGSARNTSGEKRSPEAGRALPRSLVATGWIPGSRGFGSRLCACRDNSDG